MESNHDFGDVNATYLPTYSLTNDRPIAAILFYGIISLSSNPVLSRVNQSPVYLAALPWS
jgi:hypothetical protein